MIDQLTIRGFKRFDTARLSIEPLTVLTGLNGAGKTSVIQALLLMREANKGQHVKLRGPFDLELGTASDVINWQHTTDVEFHVREDDVIFDWVLQSPSDEARHLLVISKPDPLPMAFQAAPGRFTYLSAERLGPRVRVDASSQPIDELEIGVRGEFAAEIIEARGLRLGFDDRHHPNLDGQPQGFPANVDIAVNGGTPVSNPDVAWVHHSVRDGRAVACIGLWRTGVFSTASAVATENLHWVGDSRSVAEFWREGIDVEGNTLAVFERLAARAYPELYFFGNVLHRAGDFVGGYHANAANLKRHLAVLNDYGHWAFTAAPPAQDPTDPPGTAGNQPPDQLVQTRFARKQVDIAPEHANVKSNKTCREAREVALGGGKVLYCEWHCKLQGHQNRIHIHRPVTESNDKLVVAIFAQHLPLPGD